VPTHTAKAFSIICRVFSESKRSTYRLEGAESLIRGADLFRKPILLREPPFRKVK
jgi:hypothetical protein